MAKKKQFDKKLSFIITASIINVIAVIVDNILCILLFVLFIIGFLCVSAGEYIHIPITDNVPTIILVGVSNVMYVDISGIPTNASVDETRHIHVFEACIPNEFALIIENIIVNVMNSFSRPNIAHSVPIIIIFVIVKYIASSPYFISASFISS